MRTVIITGASDGLGKELARICIEDKIQVINISRSPCDLKEVINIKCDLAIESDIINAVNSIKQKHPMFDAFVNCAGVITHEGKNKDAYPELERVIKVNTLAPMFLTSQLFDLIKKNGADVVNVGSTAGIKGTNSGIYGTSKWALRGVSENLRLELSGTPCRVVQFNPSGIGTKLFREYHGRDKDSPENWMNPKDVASIILFALKLPKRIELSELIVNRKPRS